MWGEALSSNQPKPGNDYVDINAGWLCRSWLTFLLTNKRSREAQGTGKRKCSWEICRRACSSWLISKPQAKKTFCGNNSNDNLYRFLGNPETGESYFEKHSNRESYKVVKVLTDE